MWKTLFSKTFFKYICTSLYTERFLSLLLIVQCYLVGSATEYHRVFFIYFSVKCVHDGKIPKSRFYQTAADKAVY